MKQNSLVIGLTGQIGAGKTTVSNLLLDRGYQVIDADIVARHVVQKGMQCLVDLSLEFGIEILNSDGSLNRRKLGSIVFVDHAKRRALNRITFPYIQQEIVERIAQLKRAGTPVIFLDAPTLFESGSERYCDRVVSVIAPRAMRIRRIMQRDPDLTAEQVEHRMDSQQEDEYYTLRSDFVICNDEDLASLRVQVTEMLEMLCGSLDSPQPSK